MSDDKEILRSELKELVTALAILKKDEFKTQGDIELFEERIDSLQDKLSKIESKIESYELRIKETKIKLGKVEEINPTIFSCLALYDGIIYFDRATNLGYKIDENYRRVASMDPESCIGSWIKDKITVVKCKMSDIEPNDYFFYNRDNPDELSTKNLNDIKNYYFSNPINPKCDNFLLLHPIPSYGGLIGSYEIPKRNVKDDTCYKFMKREK